MHESVKALKTALGYAEFKDVAIHNRTLKLLDELGTDLDAAGYEPGPDVEIATHELEEAENDYDREVEDIEAAINSAEPEPEDEETES